jgi:hypothetical protein
MVWCLSESYAQNNNCKKQLLKKNKEKRKQKRNTTAQIGTNVRARGFNAGLLARRSCDRPTQSRFSVVFLRPRANAELLPKFHIALHEIHAALPKVT